MTNLLICAKTISPQPDGAGRAAFHAMSSRISRILVATVILCAATAAGARQPPITVSELEQRINALVNGEQRARSLKPLDLEAAGCTAPAIGRTSKQSLPKDRDRRRSRRRRSGVYHASVLRMIRDHSQGWQVSADEAKACSEMAGASHASSRAAHIHHDSAF